jgi:hypothetical protein
MVGKREIPSVPAKLDTQLRNFLSAIREALNSGQAGGTTTINQTVVNGGGSGGVTAQDIANASQNLSWIMDTTTPPTPSGFTITGLFNNTFLHWNAAGYTNHSFTEIWRANALDVNGNLIPVGNVSWATDAVLVATSNGNLYVDNVEPSSKFYYWIRFRSMANVAGPLNQSNGTLGETTWNIDDVMAAHGWTMDVEKLYSTGEWVGNADILNGAIDNFKIADFAVDNAKIANLAVGTTKIAAAAITAAKIAALAVETAHIADLAVTDAKIASLSVEKLVALSAWIASADILDGAITSLKIGNTIQSDNYNGSNAGWQLNRVGGTLNVNQITVRDAAGNVILSSGTGVEWPSLVNRPTDDALLNANMVNNNNMAPALVKWTRSAGISLSTSESLSLDGTSLSFASSASTKVASIFLGSLNTNTDYTLSFRVRNTSGSSNQTITADLFPDTLPQENFTALVGDSLHKVTWNSAHSDMSNATLRFICPPAVSGIRIFDVKFEFGGVRTPWSRYKADIVGVNNPLTGANTPDYVDSGNTALLNALQQWADVSGSGKPVDNATRNTGLFATLAGKLTAANISTYIDSAAIGNAYIGNAAIGTLNLGGQAVIVPAFTYSTSSQTFSGASWTTILQLSVTISGLGAGETIPILITGDAWIASAQLAINDTLYRMGQYNIRIYRSASSYLEKNAQDWSVYQSVSAVDNVGNGTYTYYLQLYEVFRNGTYFPNGSVVKDRSMTIMGVKR